MAVGLLIIYIVLVLLRPQEYISSIQNLPVLSVVFILTFISWILTVKKDFSIPQPLLMLIFSMVGILSVVMSEWFWGAWELLPLILPLLAVFLMLSMTMNTYSRIRVVLDIIAICAFILSLHSIDMAHTGYGWTGLGSDSFDGRIYYLGIFGDPNDLGALFVSALPIIIHWMGRERGGVRLLYLVMLLTLIYGIYLTDSRGTMVAAGLVLILEIGRRYGYLLAGVVSGALVAFALAYTRLATVSVQDSSAYGRIEAWYEGFRMFLANPFFGVGYHNFREHHFRTAHNSFLLVLAETGVVGFYFWLAMVIVTFVMIVNFLRQTPETLNLQGDSAIKQYNEFYGLTWTVFILLSGYITAIFFLSRSYDPFFNIVFGLSAGLCLALQKNYSALPKFRILDKMGGWALSTIAGVIITYVVIKVLMIMHWA